ncbi:MAG: AMIN domain-containing protein, partial [Cyanobacteria bacterium P01_D01_bin.128]
MLLSVILMPTAWANEEIAGQDNSQPDESVLEATPSTPAPLEMLREEHDQGVAPPPATTVAEWVAQIEASQVQITGVRIEPTEAGLSVVLETAAAALSVPTTEIVGNAVVADIPNAVLALPAGNSFEQFEPAESIALVSVTEQPDGSVRVAITGTDAPPQAEVSTDAGTLVLSVEPGVATAADADA